MANFFLLFMRSLVLLPILFSPCLAHFHMMKPGDFGLMNREHVLGPHEQFGNPFGNPNDFKSRKIPNDVGTPMDGELKKVEEITEKVKDEPAAHEAAAHPDALGVDKSGKIEEPFVNPSGFNGQWELFSKNSGVSAMHSILLPKVEKVIMYDATIWRISNIMLPNGVCRILDPKTGEKDCWAHSVLFDANVDNLIPLELNTDTWCSSGGLTLEGNFVSTGGFQGGANTVRYLDSCQGCTWREYPTALAAPRWYSTQAQLADGRFIVVGGRDAQSFEYIPPEGQRNAQPIFFDFLKQTLDPEENNLYPFVFLSTDSNVFIFANNRSVLLNPATNTIVKEFPVLPGGHRNYPASGMSVILPIRLHSQGPEPPIIPAEVLVCGGSAHIDSYSKAEKGTFYECLEDCGRIRITDPNPVWKRELMPSARIMGDMMLLPSGEVLIINGAKRGASGWGFAREPNFTPLLYTPKAKLGKRFRELAPSAIPRMYHSSSVVLPDGRVMIAGSNTNNGYIYEKAMFPTELRVEKFSPPYLDPALAANRPEIMNGAAVAQIAYKAKITLQVKAIAGPDMQNNMKITMGVPGFSTHGVTMNQRLIVLGLDTVTPTPGQAGVFDIVAGAPPNSAVAPTGYYMLSVVYQGIPSKAVWVQLK
ncbi:Aldehyde oxidase GLOX1 [Linum grandiflorum]|uniref:Glyoxal oxidase 5 n=1 Tax=Linum grandiflorum TaxID=559336 RepID=G9M8U8_9ROSI|nr:glyoxal oxidase 5 [Linum grandiflorum]